MSKTEKNNLNNQFNLSCSLIKMCPSRPSDKDLLYLYGMYKQAQIGNCTVDEPSKFNFEQHSKWSAWKQNTGMEQSVAKSFYIAKVDEIYTKLRH
uniref:Acyl-Coa-Binding Protein n=1 Tax=Florenciella sp. virus SA2 TaxID=3240092 RepID=A0AB39J8D4_9VIRU